MVDRRLGDGPGPESAPRPIWLERTFWSRSFRRALGKTELAAYTFLRMMERRRRLWRSALPFMSLAAIRRSSRPATGFT